MNVVPNRGEVWLVDLGMIEKVRPGVILSGPSGPADRNLITIIPHTTALRGSEFEIDIPMSFRKPGAFLVQSPATVPIVRAQRLLGRMNPAQVREVELGLLRWLRIETS